ncbi:MAG: transglycosylase SLT domain-containing protein [Deltaproteobacteria bacterium]|nr:transglycosylase SLT domain-containing protein [Deltaproteobacteria bacterium]
MRRSLTASLFSIAAVCLLTSGPAHAGVAQYWDDLRAMAAPVAPVTDAAATTRPETRTAAVGNTLTRPNDRKAAHKATYIYACGFTRRAVAGFLIVPLPPLPIEEQSPEAQPTALYSRAAPTVAVMEDADPADYEVCSVDASAVDTEDAEDDATPVDEELVAAVEEMASVDADPASPAEEVPAIATQAGVIEETAADAITAATEEDIAGNYVPVVMNRSVESFIKYFQTRGRKHFVKWLSRSPEYMTMLQGILRENGLPEDICYIALIESGLNPRAKSRAKAVGMWQFIKGTGKKFGLRIDWWIDERMDPEKATLAAAKYFKNLYGEFGSWYLAAAGYNAGEGRVRHAVRKHRTSDFWELATHKKPLRRETREYVPKYLAAMLIAKDPQGYGFDAEEFIAPEAITYEKVNIPAPTDLHIIAEAAGTTADEIKRLNPELLRWFTPPNYPGYEVKIPAGTKDVFIENFAKVPPQERLVYHMHTVKRGDTLSRIAKRYGTDVKAIQRINDLKSVRNLKIGSTIAIPVPPEIGERKKLHTAQTDGRSA